MCTNALMVCLRPSPYSLPREVLRVWIPRVTKGCLSSIVAEFGTESKDGAFSVSWDVHLTCYPRSIPGTTQTVLKERERRKYGWKKLKQMSASAMTLVWALL